MRLSDKIAQSLQPLGGQSIIACWKLYYDYVNEPEAFFACCASTNGLNVPIVFGGINYAPIPCEIDPIEKNSLGRVSRPEIRISNENKQITQLMARKNDFRNAKLVRVQTLIKYLDAVNFDSGENPYGIPDPNAEVSRETFIVYQKIAENKVFVTLSLSAPFDLAVQTTPGRTVLSRFCSFQYRGKGCNYCGKPIAKKDDSDFTVPFDGAYSISSAQNLWVESTVYSPGNTVYVDNKNDPPRTVFVCKLSHIATVLNNPNQPDGAAYWDKDDCSKTITGCSKRFMDDISNPAYLGYLRFAGYPGTDQYNII